MEGRRQNQKTAPKMEEKAKEFDQKNHDVNDIFGRTNAKALFLFKWNIQLEDNPDKFGIDLFGKYKNITLKVEACVHSGKDWTSNKNIQDKYSDFMIWQRRPNHLKPSTEKEKFIICMCNKDGNLFATLNITKEILKLPKQKRRFQPRNHNTKAKPEMVIPVNHNKWKFHEI